MQITLIICFTIIIVIMIVSIILYFIIKSNNDVQLYNAIDDANQMIAYTFLKEIRDNSYLSDGNKEKLDTVLKLYDKYYIDNERINK